MLEIDRWALAKYAECADKIVTAYDDYDYPAIFQAANTFITVDLSAFYVDVTKDRMYTFGAKSEARRSGQTAMLPIVDGLARLLAPVLSVTMDELWRALPGKRLPSVHMAVFPMGDGIAGDRNPDLLAKVDRPRCGAQRGESGARAEAAGAGHQGEPLGAGAARGRRRRSAVAARLPRTSCPRCSACPRWSWSDGDAAAARRDGRGPTRRVARRRGEVRALLARRARVSRDAGTEGLCPRCVDALAPAAHA